MRFTSFAAVLVLAHGLSVVTAAGSVCSSGIYAALAPLETYPPAQSYCASKYPGTITVTVTQSAAAKIKRATSTTTTTKGKSTSTKTKTTTTSTKTSTTVKSTTSSVDAKASIYSSLLAQASAVVSTFCSCAGYPATTTTTVTPVPTAVPAQCVSGVYRQSGSNMCYSVQCNAESYTESDTTFNEYSGITSINACLQVCTRAACVFGYYDDGTPYCFGGDSAPGPVPESGAAIFTQTACPANKRDLLGELPLPVGRYIARDYGRGQSE